jgi:hypothetical protein
MMKKKAFLSAFSRKQALTLLNKIFSIFVFDIRFKKRNNNISIIAIGSAYL